MDNFYQDTSLDRKIKKFQHRDEKAFVLGGIRYYYGIKHISEKNDAVPVKLILEKVTEEIGDMSTLFPHLTEKEKLSSLKELVDYEDFDPNIPSNVEKLYELEVKDSTNPGKVINKIHKGFKLALTSKQGNKREDLNLFQSFFKHMVILSSSIINKTGWSYSEIGDEVIRILDVEGLNSHRREDNISRFKEIVEKVSKSSISESADEEDNISEVPAIEGLIQDFPPTREQMTRDAFIDKMIIKLVDDILNLVEGKYYSDLDESEKSHILHFATKRVYEKSRDEQSKQFADFLGLIGQDGSSDKDK